jgi:uncharacterized protein YggU (UPF0235/DUF167 family)
MIVKISIYVQAGAKQTRLWGFVGSVYKISLREQAIDGAANKALCLFIADLLSLKARQVNICQGFHSRNKLIAIDSDLSLFAIHSRLGGTFNES